MLSAEGGNTWRRQASRFVGLFAVLFFVAIALSLFPSPKPGQWLAFLQDFFTWQTLLFVLCGFLAQLVDGALGMGYGMISSISLLSAGVSPVTASAAIHTSEVFASGISGYSHYRFGNVNKKLFAYLVIPGTIGAVLGALLLVWLGEKAGDSLRPLIALYALFMGLRILLRVAWPGKPSRRIRQLGILAAVGGFFDSFGGGGWGPIVTSTLIYKGRSPRYIVGSVSLTEFFITLASAATFTLTLGASHFPVVAGLLIGGVAAAPLAARLAGKLPVKTMLVAVGFLVVIWSLRILIRS